ncbi:MAG TPA: gephyrin-like molybdotransferase Glp [Puia sp.]|nr:gephyrin-like molybdotransferase Glp [Puia sp.]
MISVREAKNIIETHVKPLLPVKISLGSAVNCILAEDVFSPVDIPAYPQSSMDGYAFRFEDYASNKELQVDREVQAGNGQKWQLQPQQAARIFTGAPVPDNADTVVMQEKASIIHNRLLINDHTLAKGTNVRPKGGDIKQNELAIAKDSYLSPAAVGFLASIGITEVLIYPKPVVHIIATGKELQLLGKTLQYGQVYESNSIMLEAALQQQHIGVMKKAIVDDDLQLLQNVLQSSLNASDVILLTGGVSVGDYDFVVQACNACGIQQKFHRIKQKPGKPLYFGKKDSKLVFGLPGNPSSVLTCFYEYVVPALDAVCAKKKVNDILHLPLAENINKKAGLTHFLKAKIIEGKVLPLGAQESYRLSSFALADGLIVFDEDQTDLKKGDLVEVHLLGR